MSSPYLHLDYRVSLEHPEYFPLFALISLICLQWNIMTNSCLVYTSLTQVTDRFLIPRPGGSTCKVFPHRTGKVDIEEVCAIELQRFLQLLHTHVGPAQHERKSKSNQGVSTQRRAQPHYSDSDTPSQCHFLEGQGGWDQAVMKTFRKFILRSIILHLVSTQYLMSYSSPHSTPRRFIQDKSNPRPWCKPPNSQSQLLCITPHDLYYDQKTNWMFISVYASSQTSLFFKCIF